MQGILLCHGTMSTCGLRLVGLVAFLASASASWTLPSNPAAVAMLRDAHLQRNVDIANATALYMAVVTMGDWAATGDALFALGELSFPHGDSVDFIERSARLGNPSAQHHVALMHAVGFPHPSTNLSLATSILHDHFASTAGNAPASKTLGYRAMFGQGVPRSCAHALVYYKRAASIVASTYDIHANLPSYPRLPELQDDARYSTAHDFNKLIFLAAAASKTKNGATLYRIAKLLLAQPSPPDYTFVRKLLSQALAWGHLGAAAHLGRMYAHGWGVAVNSIKAREYFLMAPPGDAEALHGLGLLSLPSDTRLALHYFQAASKLGHLNGIYHAATLLTSIAPQQARRYFEAASMSGHVVATFKYAEIVERTNDLASSFEAKCTKVVALYKRVAESVPVPLLDVALTKFQAREYTSAYYLYRLVAEEGNEVAQTNAAFLIRQGYVSEPIDRDVYLSLLRQAARQGSAYAHLELAHASYARAEYAEAMTLYATLTSQAKFQTSTSAYVFVSSALFSMGYMHEMGLGVPADRRKAMEQYTRLSQVERRVQVPLALWKWKWWMQDVVAAAMDTITVWMALDVVRPAKVAVDQVWVY
ncbi:hypothetical protein DYB36_001956 [Aphanomyces astaci]|uniref:Pentacotripeptide-repeat region of PRORP domain-containing protein n=2 Tax=Aphanomyces astaci TaxID=112090 RepID=A0A397B0C0_APHAT|nr:hypothetical protein DYB36_001956 [Aphanomyces astaci]